jgi:hypothetical protein
MRFINWIKDVISINEFKTSVMILVFLLYSLFGIYFYWTHHDLTDNYVLIIQTLAVSVGGVNVASMFKKKEKKQDDNEPMG